MFSHVRLKNSLDLLAIKGIPHLHNACIISKFLHDWPFFLAPTLPCPPPGLSTTSWSLATHHPRSFWVPWTQILSQGWNRAREYLAPWSWKTLSQHKSVGRHGKHKSPIQDTRPAIYKAPSWLLGVHFPLDQEGHCRLLEKIIPFTTPWPRVTECPILGAARIGDSMQGGLDVVTSPLTVEGSWGCQWHRWPL